MIKNVINKKTLKRVDVEIGENLLDKPILVHPEAHGYFSHIYSFYDLKEFYIDELYSFEIDGERQLYCKDRWVLNPSQIEKHPKLKDFNGFDNWHYVSSETFAYIFTLRKEAEKNIDKLCEIANKRQDLLKGDHVVIWYTDFLKD